MTTLDPAALKHHLEQLPPLADDPAYLVFADWLQAQGHPWGELVVLQHRAATAPTEEERAVLQRAAERLLDEHGVEILGALPLEGAELGWHLGFVRSARLRTAPEGGAILAAAKALLAPPAARMLETLVLDPRPDRFDTTRDWGNSSENIVDPWPDWDDLGPLVHERIPHLGFGGWPASAASAYVRMPSFDAISRWLRTTIRRLELTGSGRERPDRLELLALVELDLRFANASQQDLEALAASKLPALERLSLTLGGGSHCILDDVYAPEEYEGDDEDEADNHEPYPPHYSADDLESLEIHGVRPSASGAALRRVLDALPPGVAELGLPSSAMNPDLLGALVAHPRILKLRRLDLSGCALGDQLAPLLLEARTALGPIGAIDLSRNGFSAQVSGRLAAALPNAVLGEQGRGAPDFFMRYVATME